MTLDDFVCLGLVPHLPALPVLPAKLRLALEQTSLLSVELFA